MFEVKIMKFLTAFLIMTFILLFAFKTAQCQEEEILGPDLDPAYVNVGVHGAGKCRDAILMMYMPALDEIRRLRASGKNKKESSESLIPWFAKESRKWRCEAGGTYKISFDASDRFRIYCTAHDLKIPQTVYCETLRYPQGDLDGTMWLQAQEIPCAMKFETQIIDVGNLSDPKEKTPPDKSGKTTDEILLKAAAAITDPSDEGSKEFENRTIKEIYLLSQAIKDHLAKLEKLSENFNALDKSIKAWENKNFDSTAENKIFLKTAVEKLKTLELTYSYVKDIRIKSDILAISCKSAALLKIFEEEVKDRLEELEKFHRSIELPRDRTEKYERLLLKIVEKNEKQ